MLLEWPTLPNVSYTIQTILRSSSLHHINFHSSTITSYMFIKVHYSYEFFTFWFNVKVHAFVSLVTTEVRCTPSSHLSLQQSSTSLFFSSVCRPWLPRGSYKMSCLSVQSGFRIVHSRSPVVTISVLSFIACTQPTPALSEPFTDHKTYVTPTFFLVSVFIEWVVLPIRIG